MSTPRSRPRRTVIACAAAMGVQSLAIVLAGKILFGLGLPWMVIGAFTLLQRVTPPHLQGRRFAAAELSIAAPQIASIAVGAGLVAGAGPPRTDRDPGRRGRLHRAVPPAS
jgi:hypothetical protein